MDHSNFLNEPAAPPRINAYCTSRGWLFDDLKRQFAEHGALISNAPLPLSEADAWICIRTREVSKSPCAARTLVQIHDMTRWEVTTELAACLSLVHPTQRENFTDFKGRTVVRPIGSRPIPESVLPSIPTIGFFCRETIRRGREIKNTSVFAGAIERARQLTSQPFEVLMVGYGLGSIERLGRWERRAAAPSDYARISAFVTLNKSEMVALSAYEACAAGRAVITTPRGWPHPDAPTATETTQPVHWPMVYTAETVEGLAEHIVEHVDRPQLFEPIRPYGREDWIEHQIKEARRLCSVPR